jgi:hypothetical protein
VAESMTEREGAHYVIRIIDRLIGEQEATFVNRMSYAETQLRQMVIGCLKEEKEKQLNWLDKFNEQGPTP